MKELAQALGRGYEVRMGEKRNSEGQRAFRTQTWRWQDDIKLDVKGSEFVNAVMDFVSIKCGTFIEQLRNS